jgi:hypothetical protein
LSLIIAKRIEHIRADDSHHASALHRPVIAHRGAVVPGVEGEFAHWQLTCPHLGLFVRASWRHCFAKIKGG